MQIKKKPTSILQQQKNSFESFIKQKKWYEAILWELFLMDTDFLEENIADRDKIKEYLEKKWISQDTIKELEKEYNEYLKWFYYGDIRDYPQELQGKIKANEKKLFLLKKEIVKSYKDKEFILDFLANLDDILDKELNDTITKAQNNGKTENKTKSINNDINDIKQQIRDKEELCKRIETEEESLKSDLRSIEYRNALYRMFNLAKIKNLEKRIETKGKEKIALEQQIKKEKNEMEKLQDIKDKIDGLKWGGYFREKYDTDHFKSIFEKIFKNNELKTSEEVINCFQTMISEFMEHISDTVPYLNEKEIFKLLERSKNSIKNTLQNGKTERIKNMQEKIREFIDYFFIWKHNVSTSYSENIPTAYTKTKFDIDIMRILDNLWKIDDTCKNMRSNITKTFEKGYIDKIFMDDIFIHQSNFLVLDDFIRDGYIKSANLLRDNGDKKRIETQTVLNHSDIYFSRGFTQHVWYGYGNTEYNIKNKIFVVNTMTNFAEKGYGVPMNIETQIGEYLVYQDEETYWYSIISKEVKDRNKKLYRDEKSWTYIDIRDVYIFVPESRRWETEQHLEENRYRHEYDIKEIKIIYIPEEYYENSKSENMVPTQERIINNFIKEQISKEKKEQKRIIPAEAYNGDEIGINSIEQRRKFIFFETEEQKQKNDFTKTKESKGNMLEHIMKEYSIERLIDFTKKIIPESGQKPENAKVILEKFEKGIKNKKLPLNFNKNIFKIGLVLVGNDRTFLMIKQLRKIWYTKKETLILDIIMKLSSMFLEAQNYNDRSKASYMKNIMMTIEWFSKRYHDMNVKDLWDLFFIYHMCIIEDPIFYGHRKDDIGFLQAGKRILQNNDNLQRIDEKNILREVEVCKKDGENISPLDNLEDEVKEENKENIREEVEQEEKKENK